MRNSRILAALFMVVTTSACLGNSVPDDDEVNETAQAVDPTWDAPACVAQSDNPPGLEMSASNRCGGPWFYHRRVTVNMADAHCDWALCSSWSHGYEFVSLLDENPPGTLTRNCSSHCPDGQRECGNTTCGAGSTPQAFCNGKASGRRNNLINSVPSGAPGYDINQLRANTVVNGIPNTQIRNLFTTEDEEREEFDYNFWTEETTCRLRIPSAPQPKRLRSSACGREVCRHDHDSPTFTGPGIVKPTDVFDPVGPTPPQPPVCTTCDDTRLLNGAAAKYQCLVNNRLTYQANTGIRRAINSRLKVLLAVAAHQLTGTQQFGILDTYAGPDDPFFAGEPVCEIDPLPISDACRNDALWPYGRLKACRSLGASHAMPAAAAAMLNDCAALAQAVAAYPPESDPTCRDEHANLVANLLEAVFGKALGAVTTTEDTLTQALRRADVLYSAFEIISGGDTEWLRGRISPILKQFFDRAYAARFPYPPDPFGNGQQTDARLFTDRAADEGRATDASIVRAALTGASAPMASSLLVAVLADALRGTAQHADFLTEIHDVACRYRGCSANDRSPVVDFWRLVAALPNASQLGQAIAAADDLELESPGLFQAFQAIHINHARLAAVLPLPDDGRVPPEELPAGGEELLQLIAKARRYVESYADTGILVDGGSYPVLETLPHRENQARGLLDQRLGHLRAELEGLQNSRLTLVNALLQQLQNGGEIAHLESQLDILRQRALETGKRHVGLLASQAGQGEAYAGIVAGFDAMVASGALSPEEEVVVQTFPARSLSGQHARFDGVHSGETVDMLAAQIGPEWPAELRPGEQLRFVVLNNWSPTCALRDVAFRPPGTTSPAWTITGAETATTGPEGFAVQIGNQVLMASSTRAGRDPFDSCLNANFGSPSSPTLSNAEQARECVKWEVQNTRESTRASSVTAQFESGLRLAATPFPSAPAGSLLAVLTRHGTQTVEDVQVVHRQSVVIAPQPPVGSNFTYDVYLVVNDKGTCAPPASPSLGVTVRKIVPVGSAALGLRDAMGTVLQNMKSETARVVAQGVFPIAEQTTMKSLAWLELRNRVRIDLNEVPALRDLFNAWLEMQVASIDRDVQIAEVARALAEMELEAQGVEQDLRSAGDRSRLLTLVPRWMIRNLDQTALKADLRGVFRSLYADVPPLFTLRHPVSLASFRNTPEYRDEMLALMDTGFDDRVDDAAEKLADFGEHVSAELAQAENSNPVTGERIVLAYPTPERCAAGCALSPLGRLEFEEFRVPSAEAIATVWQSLRGSRRTTLSLTAADLYEAVGEAARLTCDDHAPIIRKMVLVADLTGETNPNWGLRNFSSRGRGNIENVYPTAEGGIVNRRPPLLDGIDLPLASVLDADELGTFGYPFLAEVGAGMSPVNDFAIELTSLTASQFNRVEALYLVMDVEKQTAARDVVIPGVCEP